MGYSTDFSGGVAIDPPLNPHEISYLEDFADVRHTSPDHGVLDVTTAPTSARTGNDPQGGKPEIWCHWVPDEDGAELLWDESEKTYGHDQWLIWIIEHLIGPGSRSFVEAHLADDERLEHFTHDHVLTGVVDAQGEDPDDMWRIAVAKNVVEVQHPEIVYPSPNEKKWDNTLPQAFADVLYNREEDDTEEIYAWLHENESDPGLWDKLDDLASDVASYVRANL